MLTPAQRNDESLANEFEWLEFSDRFETSPASVWVPDCEEETTSRRVKEIEHLEASPPETAPRVRVLDESQVLPGEASFATVTLNRPSEQDIVEQSVVEPWSLPKISPRVRVLDESQVLPGEASFATVMLNQPSEPAFVKENIVAELSLPESGPRVRLLDESQVLPGEASFATAMSNEPLGPRTYSPVTEFLVRTNLNLRTLKVATLLVVSILFIATLIILEITTGVFSSRRTANTASKASLPKSEPATARTDVLQTSKSVKPVGASNPQKPLSHSKTSTPVPAKVDTATETIRKTFPERANSETSPKASSKASSNDAKSEMPRKASHHDAKSVTSRGAPAADSNRHTAGSQKRLRASVKEPVRRATASKSSKVNNSRSETEMKRRESSSLTTDAAAVKPKAEPKASPATGGAQRPRTVMP